MYEIQTLHFLMFPEIPQRSLSGRLGFLIGFNCVVHNTRVLAKYREVSVQILKYPIFLMSPERPSRSLIELMLFQTGVSSIVQNTIVLAIYLRQVSYLFGVSRTSSKKSKRMSLVPDWIELCCSQCKRARHV